MQPLYRAFASTYQNSHSSMTRIIQLIATESQMVEALKRGDGKAQRQLYDKYSARFLALCMRYIQNDMAAEDVMIEGFMKIFEKIDQYKGDGSFEGWLKRLVTNEALMYLRSHKKIEIDIENSEAQYISSSETADANLETDELMTMIAQLSTGYRTVFNMYAIEGYSHAEIAKELGISEGTSKSQLHRARALLQEMVSKQCRNVL
jgi:RNA polymerase sigma factor (sigma-70 family)